MRAPESGRLGRISCCASPQDYHGQSCDDSRFQHQGGLAMYLSSVWASLHVLSPSNIPPRISLHRPSSRPMRPPARTSSSILQTFWSLSALRFLCPILKLSIMQLGYQLITALALHVISISCSLSPALPAQGVRREVLSFETILPRIHGLELQERQNSQPAQKVLMGCPEMFKEPVHSCSSCGGESPTKAGQCKDPNGSGWYCKCTSSRRGMIHA